MLERFMTSPTSLGVCGQVESNDEGRKLCEGLPNAE